MKPSATTRIRGAFSGDLINHADSLAEIHGGRETRVQPTPSVPARLNVAPDRDPVDTTTRLGDWYTNLVHVGRTPVVLAVSDRRLLPSSSAPAN